MPERKRQFAAAIAIIAVVVIIAAAILCSANRLVEIDGGYRIVMGTFARIVAVAEDSPTARLCVEAGFDELRKVDEAMSDYKPDSELSRVNRNAFDNPVKVSEELFEVLQRGIEFSRDTSGAFDITVGPLVDLMRGAEKKQVMPSEEKIAEAKARVGFEKLVLDEPNRSVRFLVEGMRLDLGAIAKGYAVDKAVDAMKKNGAVGGMADSGGNIRCFGKPPGRNAWLVGVQDPQEVHQKAASVKDATAEGFEQFDTGKPMLVLKLKDEAVATSGDYQRFVTIGDKRYSHIIDARTVLGESELTSVTIIAGNAADADGLSTSVTVLGIEKGMALIEATEDTEAILVTAGPQGRTLFSSGAARFVEK